jgi:hypothetical protein
MLVGVDKDWFAILFFSRLQISCHSLTFRYIWVSSEETATLHAPKKISSLTSCGCKDGPTAVLSV